MSASFFNPKVPLSSEKDWRIWYSTIRSNAKAMEIWDYVDPAQDTEVPPEPIEPTPATINPIATTAA